MNAVLAYIACGMATCAIMLELRVVRHLTVEIKRLKAVFAPPEAHPSDTPEADDA